MNRIRFCFIVGALLQGLFLPLDLSLAKSDISVELKFAQELLADGDYDRAFVEYHRFAEEKNNPLAQFTLGLFFQHGWGRPADPAVACQWFEKAGQADIPAAAHFFGACLENGVGRPADPTGAARWYEKAGGFGHWISLCSLADLYMAGSGVAKDPVRGLSLCRQAAEKNVPAAQVRTGLYLLKGNPSIRNVDEAFKWLSLAAQAGIPEAQYHVGMMLRDGVGRPRTPETARFWLESAASQGFAPAYFPAGELYFNSPVDPATGVLSAHDLAKAYLWVAAARQRNENPEELNAINDLQARILRIMPASWRPDLDAKVETHLLKYPIQPYQN
jgi:TPR repeat protein